MEVSYLVTLVTWQQLAIIVKTRCDNRRGAYSYIHVGCHEAITQFHIALIKSYSIRVTQSYIALIVCPAWARVTLTYTVSC